MRRVSEQPKVALHVDDEPESRRLIGDILAMHGFDVVQASNLQDAIELSQRQRVEVYVVDGSFPLISYGPEVRGAGLQLYKRIQQKGGTRGLNYVILSGDPTLEVKCESESIPFIEKSDIKGLMSYLRGIR